MQALSAGDLIVTFARFVLMLGVLYGTLALLGLAAQLIVRFLSLMWEVVYEQTDWGPFAVAGLLLAVGVWALWEVWSTPVSAFWK